MGSPKAGALLSRSTKPSEYKGGNLDVFVDELVDFINETDDTDEDEVYFVKAEWDDDEQPEVTSPPIKPKSANGSNTALLGQAYRHIEAVGRLNAQMVDSVMRNASAQMHSSSRVFETLGDTQMRMLEAQEQNADRSHERLLEAKKDDRQAEFQDSLLKGLLACFPMFAAKLAGIMPMSAEAFKASPHYQSLKGMFQETTPDDWPHIHAWLSSFPGTPAQKAAINMAVESLMAEMIADEKKKGKANGKTEEEPTVRH